MDTKPDSTQWKNKGITARHRTSRAVIGNPAPLDLLMNLHM